MYFLSIFVKDFPLLTNSSPLLVLCLIFTPARFIALLDSFISGQIFKKSERTLNSKKANLIKSNVSLRTNWKSVSRMFFSNYWYTPSSDYFWSHWPPSLWLCWLFRGRDEDLWTLLTRWSGLLLLTLHYVMLRADELACVFPNVNFD